jgi:small conductance mechanosensitive channel
LTDRLPRASFRSAFQINFDSRQDPDVLIPTMTLQTAPRLEIPSFVDFLNALWSLFPSAFTLFVVIALALVLRRWLEASSAAPNGRKMRNQLILLGVSGFGLLLVVLLLPIGDTLRGQILSLIGIVLSAGIALSSTTFLGNMLAGVMLRAVRSFRMGDFIEVGGHFGRVSDRGLFHTEIQTEERNLTTLPNMFLVTNPVNTVRGSGTIISATVSLGYDVPRALVEKLLLEAGERADLSDAFVLTVELGDYSVTYRLAGLLTEVKSLITVRSRLRCEMLDALHRGGVEIVSPTFMNQRPLAPEDRFIPKPTPLHAASRGPGESTPEEILFDKAEEAEEAENLQQSLVDLSNEIEVLKAKLKGAPGDVRPILESQVLKLEQTRERVASRIEGVGNGEPGDTSTGRATSPS